MKSKHFIILLFILSALVLQSCRNKHKGDDNHKAKLYTCSMHPQIIRTEPGNCPICGMTLVEKTENMEGDTVSGLQSVIGPAYQHFLFSQKTINPLKKSIPIEISASGIIAYDTRLINNISARVSGRIDKSYIKYPFQQISKGQKIFEIYSPDLLTEQQNLLFLIKNNESSFIESSKQKLRLLGMKDTEIDEVIKSKKATTLISVYSNYSGYVVNKFYANVENNNEKQTSSMAVGSADNASTNSIAIKEGSYVNQGETVFKIINNTSVWAMLKIGLSDFPLVKTNQKTEIFSSPKTQPLAVGKIDFIETPNPDNQKTVNVRVFLNNNDKKFKIGQFITAIIYSGDLVGNWIPSKSILDLGKRKVVFIKKDKLFVAKVVTTGITVQGLTDVLSGVEPSDEIASDAQFFADSESFIKTQGDEK